ncbi:MAG: hypothetical protein RLZZ15_2427 [Verrucomicrobiota bacterium]|jgi:two-component system CheB/CheR fusion protein
MTEPTTTIGILDDEPQMRVAVTRLLKSHGLAVVSFATAEELLAAVCSRTPWIDCLVLDLHMPGLTGFDVLAALAAIKSPLPVIVFTGHDEAGTAARVATLGAVDYFQKPVDETTLLSAIARATTWTAA